MGKEAPLVYSGCLEFQVGDGVEAEKEGGTEGRREGGREGGKGGYFAFSDVFFCANKQTNDQSLEQFSGQRKRRHSLTPEARKDEAGREGGKEGG